jgi:hypothetical protein
MNNLSEVSKEYVGLMRGCEVQSLKYEGCVYIGRGGTVLMDGEQIDTLDTDTKVKKLWREYVKGEGL